MSTGGTYTDNDLVWKGVKRAMPENNDMYNMMASMATETSAFPPQTPVAMAYVPMQKLESLYEPENALMQGTAFPDLDKPFLDGRGNAK